MRLQCNGYVVSDADRPVWEYFGYQVISPGMIRQALADCPAGEELVLEINNDGGYAEDGAEIYAILAEAVKTRTVRAEIQSRACSAASYMALPCTRVDMSPVARFMIHRARCGAQGNVDDLQQAHQMLSAMDASILAAYQRKCGDKCSEPRLIHMMAKETWITAKEAVEMGLADGILGDEDAPGVILNGPAMPDIEKMRAAYQEHKTRQEAETEANARAQRARAIEIARNTL